MIECRSGNSFELATFLVSLLIGEGYDAYVCSGYATREQVECDQRMSDCPYLPKEPCEPPEIVKTNAAKYRAQSPPDFSSEFLKELEQVEKKKVQDKFDYEKEEKRKLILVKSEF